MRIAFQLFEQNMLVSKKTNLKCTSFRVQVQSFSIEKKSLLTFQVNIGLQGLCIPVFCMDIFEAMHKNCVSSLHSLLLSAWCNYILNLNFLYFIRFVTTQAYLAKHRMTTAFGQILCGNIIVENMPKLYACVSFLNLFRSSLVFLWFLPFGLAQLIYWLKIQLHV